MSNHDRHPDAPSDRGDPGRHRQALPDASFSVDPGFDPDGTYLTATVDVEDTDDVYDLVIHRLGQLQVDEGLPLYLSVVLTPERLARLLAEHRTGATRLHPPGA